MASGLSAALVHEAPSPTWSSRRLMRELKRAGVEVKYVRPSRISVKVAPSRVKLLYARRELGSFDLVFFRSLGLSLTLEQYVKRVLACSILERESRLSINSLRPMLLARDKAASTVVLAEKGVPVPSTMVTEDPLVAYGFSSTSSPCVVKPLIGSLGLGSLLLSDADMAFNVAKRLTSLGCPIYIQEYVRKPNRDIRAFVVGDRVIACVYRCSKSWKTNVFQGATVKPMRPEPELEDLALRACKALDLLYAGVDIAESDEGYVVFEVNASPLWKGLQRATGVDPAREIVEYVLELIKR